MRINKTFCVIDVKHIISAIFFAVSSPTHFNNRLFSCLSLNLLIYLSVSLKQLDKDIGKKWIFEFFMFYLLGHLKFSFLWIILYLA